MDQDVLSGFEPGLLQSVKCSDEDFRHSTRRRPVKVCRHCGNSIFMSRQQLRVSAAANDPQHTITFTPALRVPAALCDFTRKLQPRNLRSTRRRSVSTLPLQKICAIERSAPHMNEHFLGPGFRRRNIPDFQNLGPTESSDYNSFHFCRPGGGTLTNVPKSPCASPSGPAVKNNVFVAPLAALS